jgi:excisionase family DNA binding protein
VGHFSILPEKGEAFNLETGMDVNEKWLSVKEVSGRLGWSVDTVRRLVDRGHIKAIVLPCRSGRRKRVYRSMRIAQSEIERCIKALQV